MNDPVIIREIPPVEGDVENVAVRVRKPIIFESVPDTVQTIIDEIIQREKDHDSRPLIDCWAIELAGYMSHVGKAMAQADHRWRCEYVRLKDGPEKISNAEAENRAKATDDYLRCQELEQMRDAMLEVINALKKRHESLIGEERNLY